MMNSVSDARRGHPARPATFLLLLCLPLACAAWQLAAAQTPSEWTFCADENQRCSFTGTRRVRYGANGSYASGTYTGGVECSNNVFGDPVFGVVKRCEVAGIAEPTPTPTPTPTPIPTPSPTPAPTPVPSEWTFCAGEGQRCNFFGTRYVRYGANGTYATLTRTDGVECSNSVFGDPIFGVAKRCEVGSVVQPTPTPTPAPTPTPTPAPTPTPTPTPGPSAGDADIVRFLEQATWGPTPNLISHVRDVGFEGFLDEQFAAPASSYPTMPLYPTTRDTVNCPSGSACQRDNYTLYLLQNRFFTNGLYAPDQLRQRVAFALHQLIVVSGVEITQPSWMAPYLQTLDRHAFGNYRQLLQEITLNPAMGNYLDMAGNRKGNPNENYAREVLQLFSIGTAKLNLDGTAQLDADGIAIPAYTQTNVNNFARVFTGWQLASPPVAGTPNYLDPLVVNAAQHDTGAKTLLRGVTLPANQSAQQDLSDALDNIFNDPNVAPFISKHLIQHLVTGNPSPAYVARVAGVFNDDGSGTRGNLKAVVRAILIDEEARGSSRSETNYGRLRHPAQLVLNVGRAFGARSANGSTTSDGYLNPQTSGMGMDIFRPPSVFSYFSPTTVVPGTNGVRGPEFGLLSTSTALKRANSINTLVFSGIAVSTSAPQGTSLNFASLQSFANDPARLADEVNNLLMHGTMSAEMRASIIRAVTAVPNSNPLKRARTAVYLVATSAQYQVQR